MEKKKHIVQNGEFPVLHVLLSNLSDSKLYKKIICQIKQFLSSILNKLLGSNGAFISGQAIIRINAVSEQLVAKYITQHKLYNIRYPIHYDRTCLPGTNLY